MPFAFGVAHQASVIWERAEGARFTDNRYTRAHRWEFDGGAIVHASSSPAVVPVPLSDATGIDPEEAFVASLSSCHMLWFLFFAAKGGFVVDSYRDAAVGHMEKNTEGQPLDGGCGAPASGPFRWRGTSIR